MFQGFILTRVRIERISHKLFVVNFIYFILKFLTFLLKRKKWKKNINDMFYPDKIDELINRIDSQGNTH